MRPDIKRMNERLGYFLHEMDLANARADHAEREIERLEKELHDTRGENGFLFARNIELEKIVTQHPHINGVTELIVKNKELEKKLDDVRATGREWLCKYNEVCNHLKLVVQAEKLWHEDIEKLQEENNKLKEENDLLKQTLNAENDRLERNEELSKENAKLMLEVKRLQEQYNE